MKPGIWWLRGFRWYRRCLGGEWVHSFYLSEFSLWERPVDFINSPIGQKAILGRESYP